MGKPVWYVDFPADQWVEDIDVLAKEHGLKIIDSRFDAGDGVENPPKLTRRGESFRGDGVRENIKSDGAGDSVAAGGDPDTVAPAKVLAKPATRGRPRTKTEAK